MSISSNFCSNESNNTKNNSYSTYDFNIDNSNDIIMYYSSTIKISQRLINNNKLFMNYHLIYNIQPKITHDDS